MKPIEVSWSNCDEYLSSGGRFGFAPLAMLPIIRVINSENNAGLFVFGARFGNVFVVADGVFVVAGAPGIGGMPAIDERRGKKLEN